MVKVVTDRDTYTLGRGRITRVKFSPDSDPYGYTVIELTDGTYIQISNFTFGEAAIKFWKWYSSK